MRFLKKGWPFVFAAIVVSIGAFIFGRSQAPAPPKIIYKAVSPAPRTVSPAEKSQVKPATEMSLHEQNPPSDAALLEKQASQSAPVDAAVGGTDDAAVGGMDDAQFEEKELTDIEKRLLELGYDLSKLPRGPNGELLRGPTGGIALVAPEEIARIERERPLRKRSAEIMAELQKYANRDISNEDFLNVIALQEEQMRIQRDLGILERAETDFSPYFEYFRFMAKHTTEDGRIPTSDAPRFLELFEKMGSNIPEILPLLPHFRESADAAKKNGEEYFQLRIDSVVK